MWPLSKMTVALGNSTRSVYDGSNLVEEYDRNANKHSYPMNLSDIHERLNKCYYEVQ